MCDMEITTANVHQAKTNLSKLLDDAAAGKDVYITRRGRKDPTRFKLVPEQAAKPKRSDAFGMLKDKIIFSDDYDKADEEILAMFDKDITE